MKTFNQQFAPDNLAMGLWWLLKFAVGRFVDVRHWPIFIPFTRIRFTEAGTVVDTLFMIARWTEESPEIKWVSFEAGTITLTSKKLISLEKVEE